MKKVELEFSGGVPISLLPLLGVNIQEVYIKGWQGLSLKNPQLACEAAVDSNSPGPRPVTLDVTGLKDLQHLMSPQFKNINPSFFTSLRSVSAPMVRLPKVHHLRTLVGSCPRLSKVRVGACEGGLPLPRGTEFVFDGDCVLSTQISNDTPYCHAMLSTWIGAHDKYNNIELTEHWKTFSEVAEALLQKRLPISSVPSQPAPTFPTDLPSTTVPLPRRLSDVLTSLTLNYHILILAYYPQHFIPISQRFSDMWKGMEKFLARYFTTLRMLSVNIEFTFRKERNYVTGIGSLISAAEKSFPLMSTQLGESGGGNSGFERKVKTTIRQDHH
jgi:hypothetical protein